MRSVKKRDTENGMIRTLLLTGIIVFGVALVIRYTIAPIIVSGESMEPTYHEGDLMQCKYLPVAEDLAVGDVVSYRVNGLRVIKRIVGKPGDTLIVIDGILYVNNEPQKTEYEAIEDPGILKNPLTLKENEYFCMGDNRNYSRDCRVTGPISLEKIDRKVIRRLISFGFSGVKN